MRDTALYQRHAEIRGARGVLPPHLGGAVVLVGGTGEIGVYAASWILSPRYERRGMNVRVVCVSLVETSGAHVARSLIASRRRLRVVLAPDDSVTQSSRARALRFACSLARDRPGLTMM